MELHLSGSNSSHWDDDFSFIWNLHVKLSGNRAGHLMGLTRFLILRRLAECGTFGFAKQSL